MCRQAPGAVSVPPTSASGSRSGWPVKTSARQRRRRSFRPRCWP